MLAARPQLVCVAGGSGFVGRELVNRLVRAGHSVRVLTRHEAHAAPLRVLPLVELHIGSYGDDAFLRQALSGANVIINLVGILNERGRSGAGFWRAHVELTEQLLRAEVEDRFPARQQAAPNAPQFSLACGARVVARRARSTARGASRRDASAQLASCQARSCR